MNHLFAYGTLMCGDIMAEVSGSLPASLPGVLHGYRRQCLRGEHYPALVAHPRANVNGVLYLDVPAAAWARLDRFEGDMYSRQQVQVVLSDNVTATAMTYVLENKFLDCVEGEEWDFETFSRKWKDPFRRAYTGA